MAVHPVDGLEALELQLQNTERHGSVNEKWLLLLSLRHGSVNEKWLLLLSL
jgi:hypothetical protein